MLPRLFEFSQRDEEGVRNVVAECAGKLAAAAPDAVVPALLERLDASSPLTRCTVVNSRYEVTINHRHKYVASLTFVCVVAFRCVVRAGQSDHRLSHSF